MFVIYWTKGTECRLKINDWISIPQIQDFWCHSPYRFVHCWGMGVTAHEATADILPCADHILFQVISLNGQLICILDTSLPVAFAPQMLVRIPWKTDWESMAFSPPLSLQRLDALLGLRRKQPITGISNHISDYMVLRLFQFLPFSLWYHFAKSKFKKSAVTHLHDGYKVSEANNRSTGDYGLIWILLSQFIACTWNAKKYLNKCYRNYFLSYSSRLLRCKPSLEGNTFVSSEPLLGSQSLDLPARNESLVLEQIASTARVLTLFISYPSDTLPILLPFTEPLWYRCPLSRIIGWAVFVLLSSR